jgi:lactoylglutathione lyase
LSNLASKLFPMLSCTDLDRSLAFYGDLLGGVEIYRFPDDGDPASGHRIELCVYVDDVDEAVARTGAGGVEIVAEPVDMPWGERNAWIVDPDGNLVMLTQLNDRRAARKARLGSIADSDAASTRARDHLPGL